MIMYLYGASGHGKVVKEILDDSGIEVKAFIDDNLSLSDFFGLPVLHQANGLEPIIVCVGKCDVRRQIVEHLNCKFASAIHSSAVVSPSAKIGEGTVVMQGSVIQADVVIGKHCIVNTKASIDHESVIEDFVHVYLAAVTANMDILQRSPHSMKVSYTELGQDATVSNNRLDLSFKNNTGGRIYITAHVENQPKTTKRWQCTVNIYGPAMAEGEHYELRSVVDDVLLPGDPILRKDTEGIYVEYEDEMYQFQTGREGYVITTYLDRYLDGQVYSSRKLYTDTYKATSDGYYVGVKPRDDYYY